MRNFVLQFLKFSIVGIIAFAIDYGLFILLHTVMDMQYILASIISYCIATIFNFVESMRHVFEGREGQSRTEQFIIFTILSIIGLGLNSAFLWFFTDFVGIYAEISKIIATFLVMIFNFITRKYFFEDHSRVPQPRTVSQIREDRNTQSFHKVNASESSETAEDSAE
jgi:putative flippase GtrA